MVDVVYSCFAMFIFHHSSSAVRKLSARNEHWFLCVRIPLHVKKKKLSDRKREEYTVNDVVFPAMLKALRVC